MAEPAATDSAARAWKRLVLLAFAAAAALVAVNVWFGPLNADEGWYLLAAQNVSRGMMPYRDFLYTQGPVLPYAYGCMAGAWSGAGVLGGRLATAVFGFLATVFFALIAGALARRRDPDAFGPAFFLSFVLLGLSPDWAYFTAIPKTYALGAFFLGLGFAFAFGFGDARRRALFIAFSGACFALAAATRATLCLAAVPVWITLIVLARRDRVRRLDWLWFAVGCATALALVYAPFLALCPDNFLFSQTYHAARASAPFGEWLVLRAGFLCFLAQGYPAMVASPRSKVPRRETQGARRKTTKRPATCDLRSATCSTGPSWRLSPSSPSRTSSSRSPTTTTTRRRCRSRPSRSRPRSAGSSPARTCARGASGSPRLPRRPFSSPRRRGR